MLFSIPKRVELFLWAMMPVSVAFLLFLLCLIPKHIWGIGEVMPILPLIPMFYWGIKASEIPIWFGFFLGIITDAVSGAPLLGLSSLLYILFLFIVQSRAKHLQKEGFAFIWLNFSSLLAGFYFIQFLVFSIYNHQIFATAPAFLQFLLTVGLYPLFHKLFDIIEEKCQHRNWLLKHI